MIEHLNLILEVLEIDLIECSPEYKPMLQSIINRIKYTLEELNQWKLY